MANPNPRHEAWSHVRQRAEKLGVPYTIEEYVIKDGEHGEKSLVCAVANNKCLLYDEKGAIKCEYRTCGPCEAPNKEPPHMSDGPSG